MQGDSLILMIDTAAPVVEQLSTIEVMEPTAAVLDTFRIQDGVSNVRVTPMYSLGENAPAVRETQELTSVLDTLCTEIPGGYVRDNNGVRAYLIVSDGAHVDTLNISRQVRRDEAGNIMTDGGSWIPLRTTAVLDDSSLAPIIEGYRGSSGYDNTECRVFRWFDPASTDGTSDGAHQWVEYAASRADVFSVTPGKLLWVKTKESKALRFGGGATVSLRDTTTVVLPPENWTDFAVPHAFGMYVGDILDATGADADSLQFYHWIEDGGRYVTEPLFIGGMPDDSLTDRRAVLDGSGLEGFSVYNPGTEALTLRVPPICRAMSTVSNSLPKRKPRGANGSWALKVVPSVAGAGKATPVVCAYDSAATGLTRYPAAPTVASAGIRLFEQGRTARYGHAVRGSVDSAGGCSFALELYNNGEQAADISFTIAGRERLPSTAHAWIVDPTEGVLHDADGRITVQVPAKGRAVRVLAVGDDTYARLWLRNVKPFARFAAYPNPFRGVITLRFMMPESARRVECRLFDPLGRQVWRHELDDIRVGGMNMVVWDGRTRLGGCAASGTYVLQLDAYGKQTGHMKTLRRRLIRVR